MRAKTRRRRSRRRPRLDKAAFFRDLGYRPHDGQRQVHGSSAPRRVVACGVRWGKSLAAAMEGLAAAMQPAERSIGWLCAPTYDLCEKIHREIQFVVLEHLRHRLVSMKESERRIVLRNMGGGLSEIRAIGVSSCLSSAGNGAVPPLV